MHVNYGRSCQYHATNPKHQVRQNIEWTWNEIITKKIKRQCTVGYTYTAMDISYLRLSREFIILHETRESV